MADEEPKAKRARVSRNIDKMASMGASSEEIESYVQSEGIQSPAEEESGRIAERRKTISPIEDLAQGVNLGLAKAGTSTVEGLAYLGDKLTGGKVNLGVGEWAREAGREAEDYYDPQGTAGKVGTVSGRVLGEGALLAAGSGATTLGLKGAGRAIPLAARAAQAIETAQKGGLVGKILANTLPAAPLDIAIGAGEAEAEGNPNPLRAGLERGALDVAGGALLTGAGHGAAKAINAMTDVSHGVVEAGARGVGAVARGEGAKLAGDIRLTERNAASRAQEALDAAQLDRVYRRHIDPLGAEQVLQRREAAAREAERMLAFNRRADPPLIISSGAPRPVVAPATTGTFDALGRPTYDLPGEALGQAPTPARPKPVGVELFTPQPEPPALTTGVRRLDASQGARYVEDGPAVSPLGGPELYGADADATRVLDRAAAPPPEAPPPTEAPPTDVPPVVDTEAAAAHYADDVELRDAAAQTPAAPVAAVAPKPEKPKYPHASARYPDGRPRDMKQLPRIDDDGLVTELVTIEDMQQDAATRSIYRVDQDENFHHSGVPVIAADVGKDGVSRQAKAFTNLRQHEARGKLIRAELKKRGWTEEGIDDHMIARRAEAEENKAVKGDWTPPEEIESTPYVDEKTGKLYSPDGTELFSNPVGPALKFGRSLLAQHGTLTGAVTGAAIGAYGNDENRVKGGLVGAAAGAALGTSAATMLRPSSIALALTPQAGAALDRAARGIDFDGTIRKATTDAQLATGSSIADVIGNRFWRAADYIGNAYGIIDRLGRASELRPSLNPRDALNFVKSSDHTVGRFYHEGTVDPITRVVTGPSYDAIFKPFGNDGDAIQKFLGYAKSLRDVGRVSRMGLAAVGDDASLHATNVAAVQAGDQVPLFRQQADVMQRFVKGVGDYAEGSGLWTAKQRAAFDASDAFFMPYQRVIKPSIVPRFPGSGGGGLFKVTDGVKAFKGSSAAIDNPALTIAEYAQNIIRRADRYRAGSAIIDAVETLGPEGQAILTPLGDNAAPLAARRAEAAANAEAWKSVGISTEAGAAALDAFGTQISKENPVIWRNTPDGRREAYLINSPGLLRAAEAMNPEYLPNWLRLTLTPLKGAKRIFTATTTALSPRFAGATNPARDVIEAFAKTEANIRPDDIARGYAEGLANVFGKSNVAKDAVDAGLGGTSMFFHEGEAAQSARMAAPIRAADRARNALSGLGAPVKFAERLGEASDLGPRLGEYHATLRNFSHKVESGEWTPADLRLRAATNARNVTIDFSNRPGAVLLRAFADYIPFFGVGLQAPVSFAAAIKRSPARALGVAAAVGGASMLAWAKVQRTSPETQRAIRDRPATEQAAFLLVPIDDQGNVVRFPLGAELGLVHAGVTATLNKLYTDDPHTGALLAEALVRALPPGVGELASGNLTIPAPLAEQALEIAKNKTDYGDRPIVPARFSGVAPAERRLETTAPTFDLMSAAIRAVGGKGRLGQFSPLEAEHLTRGMMSNATPLLTSLTDPAAEALMGRGGAAERVPRPMVQNPINPASAIIGRNPPSGTQSENDYYQAREQVNFAHGAVLDAKRRNAIAEIPALKEKYGTLVNPMNRDIVNRADKALRTIKDRETETTRAYRAGRLPADSARDILDHLRGQRQAIYRRASDLFRHTGAIQ